MTSTTTTVKNGTADFMKKVQQIKHGYVTVGIHEGAGKYDSGVSVVKVALWNEFGTKKVPERSFFRSAISEGMPKINEWRKEMLVNIFKNNWSVQKALNAIGLRIQILVQNKIKSNVPPANAPSTLKRKHGAITLNDTKLMLKSITHKVNL